MMVMGFLSVIGQEVPSSTPVDETGPVVDKNAQETPCVILPLAGNMAHEAEIPNAKSGLRDETMPPDDIPLMENLLINEQELREEVMKPPTGSDETTGPANVKPDEKQP